MLSWFQRLPRLQLGFISLAYHNDFKKELDSRKLRDALLGSSGEEFNLSVYLVKF